MRKYSFIFLLIWALIKCD